jgi:uncharacterized protein (DUF2237 family)
MTTAKNVLGGDLEACSTKPMTGFYRDGCCRSGRDDHGNHSVCVVVSEEFLRFSAQRGNDLSTPHPEFGFPGLKPGDAWCLCAARWLEAHRAGQAPPVALESTSERALEVVPLDLLLQYATGDDN